MTNVVGRANNHAPFVGPTQDQRCVYMASEGTSIISGKIFFV